MLHCQMGSVSVLDRSQSFDMKKACVIIKCLILKQGRANSHLLLSLFEEGQTLIVDLNSLGLLLGTLPQYY